MALVTQPALIDGKGNIYIHKREGAAIVLSFVQEDGTTPRDVSANAMFFEIEGISRRELSPGAIASQRIVIITREESAALPDSLPTARDFAVLDESLVVDTEDVPDVVWEGKIYSRAYSAEPPVVS